MEEIWKDIRKGYQVSNRGQVRSLDKWVVYKDGRKRFAKGRILKQWLNHKGYPTVCIHDNGKQKTEIVHRLVWEAFNGKVPNGLQINHISEDKADNRLENLNLMTPKENMNWGTRNERAAKAVSKANTNNPKRCKFVIQKSLQGEIIKIWPSIMEIHRKLGYSQGNICRCCNGDRKTHKGYIWQYER